MAAVPLSSLTEWSMNHIKDVFEASSTEMSKDAIANTFSKNIDATINGRTVTYDNILHFVTLLRESSGSKLKVRWLQSVETASNPSTNRDGVFGGFYIIGGVLKPDPKTGVLVEHERRKAVNVIIKSESTDLSLDSRRIVNLVFVANDYPVIEM